MNSDTPAANAVKATFQRGMQNIANSQAAGRAKLNDVVHSVYSEATGHVPTPAPKNQQGSWSNATGHVWGK
jgi:hypothetical protein